MRRLLIAVVLVMVAGVSSARDFLTFHNFPTRGQGPFDKAEWWRSGLTFYAPFDNPADPLRLIKGTGSLSFTRATPAMYVHPTTGLLTKAASGSLRIESNGALIEGQRTNLALQSENLGAKWQYIRASHSTDQDTAPDGSQTADRLVCDNSAAASHYYRQEISGLVDNTTYTFSSYLKKGNSDTLSNWVRFGFQKKNSSIASGYFRLSDCTAGGMGSDVTYTVSSAPNGYCRVSVTSSVLEGATTPVLLLFFAEDNGDTTFDGDNTVYLTVWGAQLEAASFPSSYIPTTTAAVTRNKDVLTFPSSGNISGSVGTFAVTVDVAGFNPSATNGVLTATTGSGTPLRLTEAQYSTHDGTASRVLAAVTNNVNTTYKFAVSYSGASVTGARNGTAGSAQTFDGNYTLGANPQIGDDGNDLNNRVLFGHIKNLRIWNRAFTDAELQSITR